MPAWLLPAIGLGLQAAGIGSSIWGANKQAESNLSIAKFQAKANERYLDKMNAYNTPAAQMERFSQAGLNPNLIYGQGSPGNQSAPLQYPDFKGKDYSGIVQALQNASQTVPMLNQTRLVDSQVAAKNAETIRTEALTQVSKLQAQVIRKNPLLDDDGFKATIDSLRATAQIKATQADMDSHKKMIMTGQTFGDYRLLSPYAAKIDAEIKLLEQRFNLNTQDAAIKAEVLKSKEFQNAILEVQKKFMADGEITPQHIVQFIQMLLMKAL